MTDLIGDRLHRLNEEMRKVIGQPANDTCEIRETNFKKLTEYGLTDDEAKTWLRDEPSFMPSDGSYHDKNPTTSYQNLQAQY